MWQEFPTWMIESMYNTPLFIPAYSQPIDPINEPGATLRLVYADMLEEEGNVEDACWLRQAIRDWYTYLDRLSNSPNPLQLWPTAIPSRMIADTCIAWICRTHVFPIYMTTNGHWKSAQTCKLNDRSPEVRLASFDALQKALCENPLRVNLVRRLIIEVERPDGHLRQLWNGSYTVDPSGIICHAPSI
jgi:hypothetical protein